MNTQSLYSVYSEETRTILERIRSEILENKVFAKLEEEYNIYEILEFSEINIQEKLSRNAFWVQKFNLLKLSEMAKYERVKDILDIAVGEKYEALRNGNVTLTKKEIETYYLPRDEKILELKGLVRKQELRVKYFETMCEAIKHLQWYMKMYIENGKNGY